MADDLTPNDISGLAIMAGACALLPAVARRNKPIGDEEVAGAHLATLAILVERSPDTVRPFLGEPPLPGTVGGRLDVAWPAFCEWGRALRARADAAPWGALNGAISAVIRTYAPGGESLAAAFRAEAVTRTHARLRREAGADEVATEALNAWVAEGEGGAPREMLFLGKDGRLRLNERSLSKAMVRWGLAPAPRKKGRPPSKAKAAVLGALSLSAPAEEGDQTPLSEFVPDPRAIEALDAVGAIEVAEILAELLAEAEARGPATVAELENVIECTPRRVLAEHHGITTEAMRHALPWVKRHLALIGARLAPERRTG